MSTFEPTETTETETEITAEITAAGPRVYKIPEENLVGLEADLAKLAKKAEKLGCVPPTLILADPSFSDKPVYNREGKPTGALRRYFHFTLAFEPVKLAGWSLAAVIDHVALDTGEKLNLLRACPSFEGALPKEYRTADPTCDHCGTVRRRNETFVCVHADGRLVRIGRNCIADYLGHTSASILVAMAEMLRSGLCSAESSEDVYGGSGGGGVWRFGMLEALTRTATSIRTEGWLSRGKARESDKTASADLVWGALTYYLRRPAKGELPPPEPTEGDVETAKLALEWARAIPTDTDSDYLYNLRAVCGSGTVTGKEIGLAASAVAAYQREQDKLRERARQSAERNDVYVGVVGERFGKKGTKKEPGLLPLHVTVLGVYTYMGDFGVTTIVRMRTIAPVAGTHAEAPVGADLVWFGSGENDLKADQELTLTGTVKKQQVSKKMGTKETILSRCSW